MADLNGKNVLIISTEFGTEQAEIETPRDFLLAAGASVTVATPDGGTIQTVISDRDPADQVSADTTIADVADSDFDALVVPGGTVNADTLRQDKDAVALARRFATAGKPIAAICHAPWLLVEA